MKTNKILMGALAAGLMAFASDTTQAGVVIDNALYVPLNIKATVSYVQTNVKGNVIKTAKITSKDILFNIWDYSKGTQLAVGPGRHIYAINKDTVLDDLSVEGFFVLGTSQYIYTETSTKSEEGGTVILYFFSDYLEGTDSFYWFELNGTYTFNGSESDISSKGTFSESGKFSSKNLSGIGYDDDVSGENLPVTGSASGSGSGKLQALGK